MNKDPFLIRIRNPVNNYIQTQPKMFLQKNFGLLETVQHVLICNHAEGCRYLGLCLDGILEEPVLPGVHQQDQGPLLPLQRLRFNTHCQEKSFYQS